MQVLEGLEAVRKRPGMYIGSTGERGLHHLVTEVVDNAVDEALAGHCDRIEITLLADGGVRVTDNGRGIPVDNVESEGKSAVEVVLTVLHAGGKFGGGGYKVSGGLHGVGVSVVNALSSRLEVEIHREGHVWTQSYRVGVPQAPLAKGAPTDDTGTTITFWASADIFETTEYSFEDLSNRLREMAFLNRGLTIALRDERPATAEEKEHDEVDETTQSEVVYRYDGGLVDYVEFLGARKDPVHRTIVSFEAESEYIDGGLSLDVAMQWNTGFTESVHTFANTINTHEGGTHEEGFRA
ncbi:MAG TPA: ATP-binding protein, partial [Actinomycetes bacterium]